MIPKGYKHTELGVLPEDWEVVRLGEIAEIRKDKFNPQKNKKVPCVELEHISQNLGILLGFIDSSNQLSIKNAFSKGDILFGKLRPYLRKFWKATFDGVCSSEIWVLQGKKVLNDFLFYLVQTDRFFQIANATCGTKMPRADWGLMKDEVFFIPPLAEQEKIAEILNTWDTQIQNFETLITEKQALKKGLCQTLLTAKTRLKGFSGDWEVVRLGDIAEIAMGASPKSEFYNQDSIGFPLIQGKNDTLGKQSITITYTQKSLKECEEGDILMSVRAPIGFVFWASEKSSIGRGVCAIRAKQNQTFLFYILDFLEKKWERIGQGSTFTAISKNDILDFQFAIPSLAEQEKIAEILSKVDNEITLLKQKLESLKSQKKGLMQNLLNGKVRVTQCI